MGMPNLKLYPKSAESGSFLTFLWAQVYKVLSIYLQLTEASLTICLGHQKIEQSNLYFWYSSGVEGKA